MKTTLGLILSVLSVSAMGAETEAAKPVRLRDALRAIARSESANENAFAVLEAAFRKGRVTSIEEAYPKCLDEAEIYVPSRRRTIRPVGAGSEHVVRAEGIPCRHEAWRLTAEAEPAGDDAGPLFPGTPAKPERYELLTALSMVELAVVGRTVNREFREWILRYFPARATTTRKELVLTYLPQNYRDTDRNWWENRPASFDGERELHVRKYGDAFIVKHLYEQEHKYSYIWEE